MGFLLGMIVGVWLGASIGVFVASLLRMSKIEERDTQFTEVTRPALDKAAGWSVGSPCSTSTHDAMEETGALLGR